MDMKNYCTMYSETLAGMPDTLMHGEESKLSESDEKRIDFLSIICEGTWIWREQAFSSRAKVSSDESV